MASEFGIRTTENLHSAMVNTVLFGTTAKTLCDECLALVEARPKYMVRVTRTHLSHATSCDECGAITKEDFETRYS